MHLFFFPVKTDAQVHELADLAGQIWREYWPAIIGPDQTEYMVEQFQSYEAISRDMAQHEYEYWFLVASDDALSEETVNDALATKQARIVGFTGGHNEAETNRFFISKIYLLPDERGKHFASKVMAFYENLCHERGFSAMYLTVNKHNELGIRAYRGKGFEVIESVETDIGCGYIMDDYIMQKDV